MSATEKPPLRGFGGSSEVEVRPAFPFRSDHPLKSCWDAALVLLAIFVIFAAPIELGFHEDMSGEGWVASTTLVADVLFLLDVPLQFCMCAGLAPFPTRSVHGRYALALRRAFSEYGQPVYQLRKISRRYLTGWFTVDLLASVPFDRLVVAGGGGPVAAGVVRLLKCMRFGRVIKAINKYPMLRFSAVVRILRVLSISIWFSHFLACLFHLLGRSEQMVASPRISAGYFVESMSTGWLEHYGLNVEPFGVRYVEALFWAFSTMTSISWSLVAPLTVEEKLFTICGQVVGSVLFAAVMGNITAVLLGLDAAANRLREKTATIKEFSNFNQLPPPVAARLQEYADFAFSIDKGLPSAKVAADMPPNAKEALYFSMYGKMMLRCPLFSACSHDFVAKLCVLLVRQVCLKGDLALEAHEFGRRCFFIKSGKMDVLQDGKVVSTLSGGSYFGDVGLMRSEAACTVRCCVNAVLYYLTKDKFESVLVDFPKYRDEILAVHNWAGAYHSSRIASTRTQSIRGASGVFSSNGHFSSRRESFTSEESKALASELAAKAKSHRESCRGVAPNASKRGGGGGSGGASKDGSSNPSERDDGAEPVKEELPVLGASRVEEMRIAVREELAELLDRQHETRAQLQEQQKQLEQVMNALSLKKPRSSFDNGLTLPPTP